MSLTDDAEKELLELEPKRLPSPEEREELENELEEREELEKELEELEPKRLPSPEEREELDCEVFENEDEF